MKKLLYMLPLAGAVLLTSCGDDEENGPTGGAAAGTIKATVDGDQFNSLTTSTYAVATTNGLTLNGAMANNRTVTITAIGASEPGTFTDNEVLGGYIETNTANPAASPTWQTSNDSTATVTITKWENDKVSGTFSFKASASANGATGTKTVTNGSFTDVVLQ